MESDYPYLYRLEIELSSFIMDYYAPFSFDCPITLNDELYISNNLVHKFMILEFKQSW